MAPLPSFPTMAPSSPRMNQSPPELATQSQPRSPLEIQTQLQQASARPTMSPYSNENPQFQLHNQAPPVHVQSQANSTQNVPNTASPLNRIPEDISLHRSLLFALDTPVQLTPQVWERFWPYVDNIWCVHQKPHPSPSTGISKIYGGCRLTRKTNFPPPTIHENSRPRQRREGGTCKAKFRLTQFPDGRKIIERTGEGHSHDLEHIDGIKRNSGVRGLVLDDYFQRWEAGGILAYLRDTAQQGDGRDLLKEAGGLYLSRQEVQNILNGALKKAYPGQDVSEVKKQQDKYRTMTTCNFRGCAAPAFPDIKALMDHRKAVHGLKSHDHSDKLYACSEKSCWRRKKSKGFSTLLGLEEHMREKHGAENVTEGGWVDPQLGDTDMGGLNSSFEMGMGTDMNGLGPLGMQDPITPDSSGEEAHGTSGPEFPDSQVGGQEAEEASRALTALERESMKLRLKRLQIERQKLDREIQRMNQILYGRGAKNSEGATVAQMNLDKDATSKMSKIVVYQGDDTEEVDGDVVEVNDVG